MAAGGGKRRWDSCAEVSSTTSFHHATVKRWCVEKRVVAVKSPGQTWRVCVWADSGWPVELDEDGKEIPKQLVDE